MPAPIAHAPAPEPGLMPEALDADRSGEGTAPAEPRSADALEGLGPLVEALLSCDW